MNDEVLEPEGRGWEKGWDGHDRAQRVRLARLSMAAKLDWLEAAHRVVRHLANSQSRESEP